jgi:anaerobic magnesium-protoporphyrin IX monomethyl ester cyclase
MKIAISSPPLESPKGIPLLSQNRQFQWFHNPTFIYPMVPASAATLLKSNGFDVLWDDAVAQELTYSAWRERLLAVKPDVVVIESKTPVIKRHWKIIAEIKSLLPNTKTILVGDHVSALPEESMSSSPVDFVVTGGHYDVWVDAVCRFLRSPAEGSLPGGVWYREKDGQIRSTGVVAQEVDLNKLPIIDRELTEWQLYSEKNGNFKFRPGTYVMAGRDCWWGRCTFCGWTTLYPGKSYCTISPERHLDEIGQLIERYGIREIFDDSGCFPKGEWLRTFCQGLIDRGYHKKAVFGCNTRVGAQTEEDFRLMKQANFRFVLIGLESINEATLSRLNKGIRVDAIESTMRNASCAGLEPHLTTMVGYPWESREEAEATVNFARRLFEKGYIHTLQATIVTPYPGTPLFEESRKQGWLLHEDWDRYDMREPVWKSPISNDDMARYTRDLYKAALSPRFIARKILSIRSIEDVRFLVRAGKRVIGHLADFSGSRKSD